MRIARSLGVAWLRVNDSMAGHNVYIVSGSLGHPKGFLRLSLTREPHVS